MLFFFPGLIYSQSHRAAIGLFFGSGISLNVNYSYEAMDNFFIRPNLSGFITKDGKDLYTLMSYEIDFGYYLLNRTNHKIYFAIGGSYNSFLSQSREGNASFISDQQPPYFFTGKSREDCSGIALKVGSFAIARNNLSIGFELKYIILFPDIKYNYSPKEYSLIKKNETIQIILLGLGVGYIF
jgi:hypothetical protein